MTATVETTATITETVRNGVDTADDVRDARRQSRPSPRSRSSSSVPPTAGSAARTAGRRSRTSPRPAGRTPAARASRSRSTPASPAILLGTDTGPNPAEYLLHALAACVTTSLVYSAAARKVRLTMVESTLEGDLDIQGCTGLNTEDFRNGFTAIRMHVRIAGDAPPEKLREVVSRGTDRSVVFDSISTGVPISVDVDTV